MTMLLYIRWYSLLRLKIVLPLKAVMQRTTKDAIAAHPPGVKSHGLTLSHKAWLNVFEGGPLTTVKDDVRVES